MTLSRTDKARLKFLTKQRDSLQKRFDRQLQTIENRHLAAEADLNATLGAEIASLDQEIAALEKKEGNDNGNPTS